MFSKVFCYYEKEDLENISKVLSEEKNEINIICDTNESKKFFSKNQNDVKSLDDFFPLYSDKTFEIYENTKKTILEYERIFKNVKFMNHSIDIGLLHNITTDILLIEKIRKILVVKKNYIFIFKNIRHVNFVIQKIAKSLTFENNGKVYLFKNGRSNYVNQTDSLTNLEKINKLSKYKKSFSLYSSNITKDEKNMIYSLFKLSKKALPMILKLSKTKIYEKNPDQAIKSILKQTKNKISEDILLQCGFFLSSDRKDLLDVYDDIFKKCVNEKIKFKIFTVDPITESFLNLEKHSKIGFFEESYILANVLKKTPQAEDLEFQIKSAAKINSLFLLYNEKLNYEIIDGIYRAIAITLIVENCLENINLKNLIIIEGTILGMITVYLGKKLKIPTYSIETLIVDKNAISSILYKADKICIYGTQGYEILLNFGINKERIEITGNPKYDYIKKIDTEKSKKILAEKNNINSNLSMILIAMSRWHDEDEIWISDFIKFANKNNFEIIIKIHPRYKKQLDENQYKVDFIKNKCKDEKFLLTYDVDLNLLISSSDVIISDYSNVGVEGVLLGKAVINVNFTNEDFTNAQNYHKLGSVLYTENYDQLKNIVKEIILEKKHVKELQNNQNIMIDRYNHFNDGMASERIFRLISSS